LGWNTIAMSEDSPAPSAITVLSAVVPPPMRNACGQKLYLTRAENWKLGLRSPPPADFACDFRPGSFDPAILR
jgi:hypothetical protein